MYVSGYVYMLHKVSSIQDILELLCVFVVLALKVKIEVAKQEKFPTHGHSTIGIVSNIPTIDIYAYRISYDPAVYNDDEDVRPIIMII